MSELDSAQDGESDDDFEYRQSEDEKSGESEDDIDAKVPELHEARAFLFNGQIYKRLLKKINNAAKLSPRQGQVIQMIRETIISSISVQGA